MSKVGAKPKLLYVVLPIVLLAVVLIYWLINQPKTDSQTSTSNTQTAVTSSNKKSGQEIIVRTSDFSYPLPAGWSMLSKEALKPAAADSGVGNGNPPLAFFYATSDSSIDKPTSNSQLRDVVLGRLGSLQNFQLLSEATINIGGQAAQQFTYLTGSTDKVKNQMIALIYNNKVYLLRLVSPEDKFKSQQTDFSKIITGFKFK